MKFGVFVALVGIATAVRLGEDPEVPPSPMPPSEGVEPSESQKKLMAEIASKGKKVVAAKKETDAENFKEAMKSNKEKAKETKALKDVEAAAADKKAREVEDSYATACAARRAAESKAKADRAAEQEALRKALRPKPDDENWTVNMPADILSGKKFGGAAPLKFAYAQQGVKK